MIALTSAATFTGYLNQLPGSRVSQSRVSNIRMDNSWRKSYDGKGTGVEAAAPAGGKQDFLEADPYWDQSGVPVNTYKNKSPFVGKITSVKRIVGPDATGETCDIIIKHDGKMPYWEGQSYGVIPPGTNPKNGKPNTVR